MTMFKIGDKVRVLDASAIAGFAQDFYDGMCTEVIAVDHDGDVYLRAQDGSPGICIDKAEFHAIEKLNGGDTMNYRTVKRKARVGERVLITKAHAAAGRYANGDVLTVREETGRSGTDDAVLVVDKNVGIFDYEYEVIVGTYGDNATQQSRKRVDALEAEIVALKGRITTLEEAGKQTVTNVTFNAGTSGIPASEAVERISKAFRDLFKAPKKSANQRRADVIAKAKAFVEDVKERALNFVMNDDGNHIFNRKRNKLTLHVNAEKRVVTALAHSTIDGKLLGKAFAKCAPGDVFNADIGMAIAAGRLYGLDVSEFVNAVQPTEFAVGQVTRTRHGGIYTIMEITGDKAITNPGSFHRLSEFPIVTITDDTEAQY